MNRFQISKIEKKLFTRIFVPTAIVLMIFAIIYCYFLYGGIEKTFSGRVDKSVEDILPSISTAISKEKYVEVKKLLEIPKANVRVKALQYVNASKTILAAKPEFTGDWVKDCGRQNFYPLVDDPNNGKIQLCYIPSSRTQFVLDFARPAFIPMSIIAFLFTALAIFTVRRMLVRPLMKLKDAMTREDFPLNMESSEKSALRNDEIDDLAESLESLSVQLFSERDTSEVAFQAYRDGIAVFDAENKLRRCNAAFCQLLDLSKDDILQKKLSQIIVQDVSKEPSIYKEFDVNEAILEMGFELIQMGVGKQGKMVLVRDLTQRKLMETESVRNEKILALGTLAGGVAHDFNNLLSGVLGASEVLQIKYSKELSPKALTLLQSIQDQVKHGKDLTNKLMDFSSFRQESFERLNFEKVVRQTLDVINVSNYGYTNITLKSQAKATTIYGVSGLLQGAIFNLIKNSIQAVEDKSKGKIDIEIENRMLTKQHVKKWPSFSLNPGEYIALIISDNGAGVPHDIEKRIFDPFFTTKPIGEGSGLGLSAVMGVVKDHSGLIILDNKRKGKTVFTMYLPVVLDKEIGNVDDEQAEVTYHKASDSDPLALIIEDEPAQLDVYEQMLELLGYQVVTAQNGKEGLALFEGSKLSPDIALLDVNTPEMNAYEFIGSTKDRISKDNIIVMTGFAETDLIDKIEGYGPFTWLRKPFDLGDLSSAVKKVERNRGAAKPNPKSKSESKLKPKKQ